MKKLLLAAILLALPLVGVSAQASGDIEYFPRLKAKAESTRLKAPFQPVRSQNFRSFQYGKAGPNQMQKSNPGDMQLRYSGVEVGWCLKWSMCQRSALKSQGFRGIYNRQGYTKKIRMGTRVRGNRNAGRLPSGVLDGERLGMTKLYYLYNSFFAQ